jgi:short-subunit dehydrogenase
MSRRSITGARVLITGASSGIGRALARALVQQGADLVVTARRQERLQELANSPLAAGRKVVSVAGDITDAAVRAHLLRAVRESFGGLDILVNNAGVGAVGLFGNAHAERLRRVMEVNFFAPAELIRAALPLLRGGRRPLVVNVGSVLGHVAVPSRSEYCASKFALHGLSDALRAEFARERIDLLLVSPSATDTEFVESVLETDGRPRQRPLGRMSAERVAQQMVRAIRRGRHEIILSPGGKLAVWLDRLCPPLVDRLVARFG